MKMNLLAKIYLILVIYVFPIFGPFFVYFPYIVTGIIFLVFLYKVFIKKNQVKVKKNIIIAIFLVMWCVYHAWFMANIFDGIMSV